MSGSGAEAGGVTLSLTVTSFALTGLLFLTSQLSNTRYTGSSAFPVLSNCVDPPGNQYRRALEDISLKNPPSHSEEVWVVLSGLLSPLFLYR